MVQIDMPMPSNCHDCYLSTRVEYEDDGYATLICPYFDEDVGKYEKSRYPKCPLKNV